MRLRDALTGLLVAMAVVATPASMLLVPDAVASTRDHGEDDDDEAESCDRRGGDNFCSGEAIVHLRDGVTPSALLSAMIDEGFETATVLDEIAGEGILLLQVTMNDDEEEMLEELLDLEDDNGRLVTWAELNYVGDSPQGNPSRFFPRSLADPQAAEDGDSWGRKDVGAARAARCSTGQGIVVAVIDTGLDTAHPAFANHVEGAWNAFLQLEGHVADVGDGVNDDGDTDEKGQPLIDESAGHGTHISGIVLQVAPGARIMPIKALDSDGNGNAFVVAQAIFHAVDAGADVVNLSLGTTSRSAVIEDAVRHAREAGVIIVAAAGNSGAQGEAEYPAALKQVIAVGATDAKGKPASSSRKARAGFNTTASGIDISAPGMEIKSAFPRGVQSVNSDYATWSGTSMASPWVAGAVALLLEEQQGLSANQVLALLQDSANPIKKGNGLGAGRLNAAKALGCR